MGCPGFPGHPGPGGPGRQAAGALFLCPKTDARIKLEPRNPASTWDVMALLLKPRDKGAWFVAALLTLPPWFLFAPALFGHKILYGFDTIGLGVPLHAEVMRCLAAHQWPLWFTGINGGMPAIASCNLQFAYPLDFLGSLWRLPIAVLNALDMATSLIGAGWGLYLFLRVSGRSRQAALLGALFFAYSGDEFSMAMGGYLNLMEGVAWAPWALLAVHHARRGRAWLPWGLCGAVFALQILAGAAQLFVYTLVLALAYATLPAWNRAGASGTAAPRRLSAHDALGLLLALGCAAVLAAPQLWPTLQYLPYTSRHGFSLRQFRSGSYDPLEYLTWFMPGMFGWQEPTYHGRTINCFTSEYFGLLPWILAAAGSAYGLFKDGGTRAWSAVALAALFLGQNRWTPFYRLFQALPVLSGFRDWHRVLFLLTLAVCLLAAQGWDALGDARRRMGALIGAAAGGLGLLLVRPHAAALGLGIAQAACGLMPWISPNPAKTFAVLAQMSQESMDRLEWLVPATVLVAVLAGQRRPRLALVLALALHTLDLSDMAIKVLRFVPMNVLVASHPLKPAAPPPEGLEPWRVFDPDQGFPNNAELFGYENLVGAESLPLAAFYRTEDAFMRMRPPHWDRWLNLMGVRYIFRHSVTETFLPGDQVKVLRNAKAFPRAWLVGRSVRASGAAAYALLSDPRFDPRHEVSLAQDPHLGGRPSLGRVQWLERLPQSFSLQAVCDERCALVVANYWYPSWRASVDGRATPVVEADGGLQAVTLDQGTHRVEFEFDPGLFDDALAACLAGLMFLVGLGLYDAQERKKAHSTA